MTARVYAAKPYFETNSHALSSRYPTLLNHNDWMKQRPQRCAPTPKVTAPRDHSTAGMGYLRR
jgi:hypothetical protein